MKKKIVLLLMLLLISAILTACVPDCPMNYLDTTWICEEPYMWFGVREGEYPAKGEVITEVGETLQVEVSFPPAWIEIYTENEDSYDCIYSGSLKMKKHGKVMEVETYSADGYESDYLYRGKTLTFKRQD